MRPPERLFRGLVGGRLAVAAHRPGRPRGVRAPAVAIGVAMAIAVSSCGLVRLPRHPHSSPSQLVSPSGSPPATMAEHPTWLLTTQAIREMAGVGPVIAVLRSATVLELVGAAGSLYPGLPATEVISFRSETAFASWTPGSGAPTPGAVLYDPEDWVYTPSAERVRWALYASRFVDLARSRSETPILAPGLDLVKALASGAGSLASRYLGLGIPREMAQALGRVRGVLEIQAQSQERSVSAYRSLVAGAVRQIRATGSLAEILAGLSANPGGGPVTSTELEADVRATDRLVSGYWLNIPEPGGSCPECAAPDPELGATVLLAVG